jgi:GNAT superfamily N-acetyltransferase
MSTPAFHIRALEPALLPDFMAFFDGEAFADNPEWGFCFCQYLHVDHNVVQWSQRTAAENRTAASDRICTRRMQGYLAYIDVKPVAWCNAAPRSMMQAFADEAGPEDARTGQFGCFVVAKPYRRSGIASALLQAALEGFRTQGLRVANAMPYEKAETDGQHHFGPVSMYLAAGFEALHTDAQGRVHVQLQLLPKGASLPNL